MPKNTATQILFSFFLLCSIFLGSTEKVEAQGSPRAQPAIKRGVAFLRSYDFKYKSATGLIIYTLVTGGEKANSPAVQKGLEIILQKFREKDADQNIEAEKEEKTEKENGKELVYNARHHYYEAGIDAMALEAIDSEKYHDQLQAITDFIIKGQLRHGGWHYPGESAKNGDTSITQYAILGLWAAHRAGIEIPIEVFEEAASWHFKTQSRAGGYKYQPLDKPNLPPTGTMAVAGSGSVGIIRHVLFGNQPDYVTDDGKESKTRFGVLEKKNVNRQTENKTRYKPKPIKPQLDAAVEKSYRWVEGKYLDNMKSDHDGFHHYYFYALERTASINHWETIGGRDWYKEGVDHLLPQQRKNGSWPDSVKHTQHAPTATCFATLFLLKATKKLLPPSKPKTNVGGGILAAGRGLPDDLSSVDFKGGKVKYKQKRMQEFDKLLAGLSNIDLSEIDGDIKFPEKKIDLSDPKKLIGNAALLKVLAKHTDPHIRQVAAKYVGKTDQLELAGLLIPLLKDEDLAVAIEARLSLCWISRQPNGFDFHIDPLKEYEQKLEEQKLADPELKEVKPDPAEQNRITTKWKNDVHQVWRKWYLKNRPYQIRDDFDDPEQARFQKK